MIICLESQRLLRITKPLFAITIYLRGTFTTRQASHHHRYATSAHPLPSSSPRDVLRWLTTDNRPHCTFLWSTSPLTPAPALADGVSLWTLVLFPELYLPLTLIVGCMGESFTSLCLCSVLKPFFFYWSLCYL